MAAIREAGERGTKEGRHLEISVNCRKPTVVRFHHKVDRIIPIPGREYPSGNAIEIEHPNKSKWIGSDTCDERRIHGIEFILEDSEALIDAMRQAYQEYKSHAKPQIKRAPAYIR